MRNISFALTTDQVRSRTKTVTRRLGWKNLKPGTLLQPIVKGQGIPKGGTVEKIGGPIKVVSVHRGALSVMLDRGPFGYGEQEPAKEGFPCWTPEDFVTFFAKSHGCSIHDHVTRIEFEYL